MLTLKHLAVIRAALKYLDEEVSPHGEDALNDYLDQESEPLNATVKHVAESRTFFKSVDLSYALVDSTGVTIESRTLFPAGAENSKPLRSDLSLIATVLVPFDANA